MPDVDLVDYGGGNLGSLQRALQRLQIDYRLVDASTLPSGDLPLILPGVGAFGAVAQALSSGGLDARLKALVEAGTPFLGICVGLQVLLQGSEESPDVPGLGLIPGRVVRYNAPKVPQIGWNRIEPKQGGGDAGFVYFVNSFYAVPENAGHVWYESDYYGTFCAALRDTSHGRHLSAFQFHPEKSGDLGQKLLSDWHAAVKKV